MQLHTHIHRQHSFVEIDQHMFSCKKLEKDQYFLAEKSTLSRTMYYVMLFCRFTASYSQAAVTRTRQTNRDMHTVKAKIRLHNLIRI